MVRLDHLSLPVRDWRRSRDSYRRHLGFQVDFELADASTVGMRDDTDLTVFLQQGQVVPCPGISFTIQVDDVDAKYRQLAAAGIAFAHPPMKVSWGYGAELQDRFRRLPAEALGSEIHEGKGTGSVPQLSCAARRDFRANLR